MEAPVPPRETPRDVSPRHGVDAPPHAAAPDPVAARRVRVVIAAAGRPRPVRARPGRTPVDPAERTRAELAGQTPIGEALTRGLIRAQLGVSLRLAALVAASLGGLPLLFAAVPRLAGVRPFGVALPWLLLGVAAYPLLFAVGAGYVHLAERIEGEFTALVERPGPEGPDPDPDHPDPDHPDPDHPEPDHPEPAER